MAKKVTINQEQELYVIPEGKGYTCLGFDVCLKRTEALFHELFSSHIAKKTPARGSIEAYNYYQELIEFAHEVNQKTGYRFQYELEPRLMGLEGKRVEVTDKDGNKRRFVVGKSMGFIPVHLEIPLRGDRSGGPAVCIFPTDTIKEIS